jgi:hypothetical protein
VLPDVAVYTFEYVPPLEVARDTSYPLAPETAPQDILMLLYDAVATLTVGASGTVFADFADE